VETVLLYVLGIVVVLVGIALSIALHEIGHLVPAKLFKVRVGQYMIGFGPTIFSRKKGETEYGVKAVPLGGYISMAGMYPPAKKGEPSRTSGTDAFAVESEYETQSAGRTASTGFFQAMVQDARTQSEDTIEAGHEDRVFYKLPVWKRIIIMLGGPAMNVVIAIVLFAIVLSGIGTQGYSTTISSVSKCVIPATSTSTTCAETDPVAPAAAAGIKPGDRVVSINGTAITTWAQETAIIKRSAGKELSIVVERAGSNVNLTATPIASKRYVLDATGNVVKDSAGKEKVATVGFLGIGPSVSLQKQPLTAVLPAVGSTIAADAKLIANLPAKLYGVVQALAGTEKRDANGPMSVVGAGRIAGEITSTTAIPFAERFSSLLGILASLNIALFAFNLIPLLPLDGGHVAGALWEGIRRFFAKLFKRKDPGPVDIAKLVPLTFAVVIILGLMSALLIVADIFKPVSIG
jgi:membrane-associated protease RseP (regulator of RpoE activity)